MSYWEERLQDYKKWAEKNEDELMKRLVKIYQKEAKKLEKQIAAYYAKYGKDNVLEYRNMMQKLSDDEVTLLIEKMDEFALKYPQYAHLMPIRESIYKLNRLEGLQYYVKIQQSEIGAINHTEMEKYFEQSALKGSNIAMETMGFGKNFYKADSNIIKEFVGLNWANGKNFSTSIWENVEKLAKYLTTDIAQGIARGDSYDKLTKQLRERFEKVSRNDAKRLIFTEGTYIMAESSIQSFKEDFEYYKVATAEDKRVCPICKEVAEKTFKISERQPGVNFPPLHPWCRCSFTIEVEDWDKWRKDYEEKHGGNKKQADKIKKNLMDKSMYGGALSGAWNDKNDPYDINRRRIALDIYTQISNRKKEYEVKSVSKNSGFTESEISRIYEHIFIREHLFRNGKVGRFDPDYYMAHSWQRLREGKNIQKHDITMLYHELEEEKIMGKNLEIAYEDAHEIVQKKYNYQKELFEYLRKHDV